MGKEVEKRRRSDQFCIGRSASAIASEKSFAGKFGQGKNKKAAPKGGLLILIKDYLVAAA